jgi:hypothetical protein
VNSVFLATRKRLDCAIIRDEWIQRVIDHPVKETIQSDGPRKLSGLGDYCRDGRQVLARYTAPRSSNRPQRVL